jgi:hypothetical protein
MSAGKFLRRFWVVGLGCRTNEEDNSNTSTTNQNVSANDNVTNANG